MGFLVKCEPIRTQANELIQDPFRHNPGRDHHRNAASLFDFLQHPEENIEIFLIMKKRVFSHGEVHQAGAGLFQIPGNGKRFFDSLSIPGTFRVGFAVVTKRTMIPAIRGEINESIEKYIETEIACSEFTGRRHYLFDGRSIFNRQKIDNILVGQRRAIQDAIENSVQLHRAHHSRFFTHSGEHRPSRSDCAPPAECC